MLTGTCGPLLAGPWFWTFLAVVGWGMGVVVVGTRALGRRLDFGIAMFVLAEVPRIILPMPFVIQPRIGGEPAWMSVAGAIIFLCGLVFATPVVRIAPLTAPDRSEQLRTDGLYAIVRHPLMLSDLIWPIGWSLIFGSVVGLVLTAAWLPIIWLLIHVEEEALVRVYGSSYRDYQARVPKFVPRISSLWARPPATPDLAHTSLGALRTWSRQQPNSCGKMKPPDTGAPERSDCLAVRKGRRMSQLN